MALPVEIYRVIYENLDGNIRYLKGRRRLIDLVKKGLLYEKQFVNNSPDAKVVPIHVVGGAPPVCHERPMVDYGDCWYCLVGSHKVAK